MDLLTHFMNSGEVVSERICPNKCGDDFAVSVQVEQVWTVSANGILVEITDDGEESAEASLESAKWHCLDCGFEAGIKCSPDEFACGFCGTK